MYRIMLADDEGIVIDSFTYLLEEEFGDDVIIESGKTGRSVIELAERFRPDIAIMDIRMPGINGIDAIREIRKRNSQVVFIVASAYDKFDYAKEAINLGVMDYLNKPVEKNQFIETVKKAMEIIDRDREKRTMELETKEKLETVVPIIESGLIYNLLFQDFFKDDLVSFNKLLEIDEKYGYMIVLLFGDDQQGNQMTNAIGISVKVQNYIRDLRDIVKGYTGGIVGPVMANKIAVFVPTEKTEFEYNERINLIETARLMVRRLNREFDIKFRAGIGTIKPLDKMVSSYNEGVDGLTMSSDSVIHADDLAIGCGYEEDYPIDTENNLIEGVRRGDLNMAINAAGQFFDWMVENYNDYDSDIKVKTLEFVIWAEHLGYSKGGKTYRFRSREDYLPYINSVKDYDELRSWFIDKISEACQNVMFRKEAQSTGIIDKAKEYIYANFKKDISLDDVSREVDISPYYFSKIFKKETGENFIEYLTNIRIEKAKELLENTDMSMKEICLEVGYSNPNYFSRSFKKNVGVTPTEYKG